MAASHQWPWQLMGSLLLLLQARAIALLPPQCHPVAHQTLLFLLCRLLSLEKVSDYLLLLLRAGTIVLPPHLLLVLMLLPHLQHHLPQ